MQSSSCLFGNRIYNIFYIKIYLFLILLQLLKKKKFSKFFLKQQIRHCLVYFIPVVLKVNYLLK